MTNEQNDNEAIEAAARIVQAAGFSQVFAQVAPLLVAMRKALIDEGMTSDEADGFAAAWLLRLIKDSQQ